MKLAKHNTLHIWSRFPRIIQHVAFLTNQRGQWKAEDYIFPTSNQDDSRSPSRAAKGERIAYHGEQKDTGDPFEYSSRTTGTTKAVSSPVQASVKQQLTTLVHLTAQQLTSTSPVRSRPTITDKATTPAQSRKGEISLQIQINDLEQTRQKQVQSTKINYRRFAISVP